MSARVRRGRASPRPRAAGAGSAVETVQSLPNASRAPARVEAPERVHAGRALRADERLGQLRRRRRCGRPRAGDTLATTPSSAKRGQVVRVDELEVGEVVARVAAAVRPLGRLDRVEGVAHGAVADRVHVHLEAVRVEQRRRRARARRLVASRSRVVGADVGLEQRAGEVLEDAVDEDLRAADPQPAERAVRRAARRARRSAPRRGRRLPAGGCPRRASSARRARRPRGRRRACPAPSIARPARP